MKRNGKKCYDEIHSNPMNKKNIIFLGIGFHNYDKCIIQELSKRYNVLYVNTRKFELEHRAITKVISFINKKYVKIISNVLLKNQLERLPQNSFEKLFVIKGTNLSRSCLERMQERQNLKKSVLYLWDKWENHDNIDEICDFFDEIFSFDTKDCRERGLKLRPLFYFENQIKRSSGKNYVMSFIGGDHSDRYHILRRIKSICKDNKWTYSFNLLIGKVAFFKYRLNFFFKTNYRNEDSDMLIGKSLPYSKYVDIVSHSNVVIDMQATGQTGLTMRTIEALAMGTRIITTNAAILEYDDIPDNSYLLLKMGWDESEIIRFVEKKESKKSWLPNTYESLYALRELI